MKKKKITRTDYKGGKRYQEEKRKIRKKVIVGRHRSELEPHSKQAQEKYLRTPFWSGFDLKRASVETQQIEWKDDDEKFTMKIYASDELIQKLLQVNMTFAVFFLCMRLADEVGYVDRTTLFRGFREFYPDTGDRNVRTHISKALLQLKEAELVDAGRHNVYINPHFAYKGDRGGIIRMLF